MGLIDLVEDLKSKRDAEATMGELHYNMRYFSLFKIGQFGEGQTMLRTSAWVLITEICPFLLRLNGTHPHTRKYLYRFC